LAAIPEQFGMASHRITEPEEVAALITFLVSDGGQHRRRGRCHRRRHHQDQLTAPRDEPRALGFALPKYHLRSMT
jgi:ABC-type Fe3+ transport system substrate-binding protein